ncbi:MAG: DUF1643 domain-containing protein [Pseudomonadota bacterium]
MSQPPFLQMREKRAVLSECRKYRYRLDRYVGGRGVTAAFFGINPSKADAVIDDATVRKWHGFSRRLGFQRFIVGNIFAYRATDVRELRRVEDPVGPEWRTHIDGIIAEADVLIPCWGNAGKLPLALRDRMSWFIGGLIATGKPVTCWGLTKSGDPRHPLMLSYDTPLVDYRLIRGGEDD